MWLTHTYINIFKQPLSLTSLYFPLKWNIKIRNYKHNCYIFRSRVHRIVKSCFSIKESSNNHTLEACVSRWSTRLSLKTSQNSQGNTCVGVWISIKWKAKIFFKTHKKIPLWRVSFLIKLQAAKIRKVPRKISVLESCF